MIKMEFSSMSKNKFPAILSYYYFDYIQVLDYQVLISAQGWLLAGTFFAIKLS